jgi:putative nucleotidyltransferase with HDIG domain
VAIAQRLNLPTERVEGIRVAAALHDIGKMSTPAEILSKPGKLSKQEFDLLRQHPRVAHDILEGIPFPWPVANIVLQHHERLDGSGYPNGLEGDNILIEARIIAVADTVEAMSSHRPYRPALGLAEALHEIQEHKGTRYDPEVVAACVDLFENGQFSLDSQEPAATSTTGD